MGVGERTDSPSAPNPQFTGVLSAGAPSTPAATDSPSAPSAPSAADAPGAPGAPATSIRLTHRVTVGVALIGTARARAVNPTSV